jgi:TonB family protein
MARFSRFPLLQLGVAVGLFATAASGRLVAQQALYVRDGSDWIRVTSAHESVPLVDRNGRREPVDSKVFGLQRIEEYAPYFVAVRNVRMQSKALESLRTGDSINARFNFAAEFESAYALREVMIVVELVPRNGAPRLYLRGLGDLPAYRPWPVALSAPAGDALGEFKARLHVFSEGRELLHSEIPFEHRERALDRMVARRVHGIVNAGPRPLLMVPPAYPPALRKRAPHGVANLRFTLDPKGNVRDASVVSASDPAFAEAGLLVIQQWRFVPKVADGHPVSATVELPLTFSDPDAKG